MTAKRGRPRGLNINPAAVHDLLAERSMLKTDLCNQVGISSGQLSDMLYRRKGTSRATVEAMAAVLQCSPQTIAPTLHPQFLSIRRGDPTSNEEMRG